ncbi:hypothetical protein [Halosimplex marinum]|uniref:hypothetical protein n=1 Tax=Halosimplex marinum TaxID=3396620 RepID=UPI003F55725B
MELRSWIRERYNGTGETLLDESAYSDKELRKDISKLEHRSKKLEKEMDKHRRKYKKLLQEGAEVGELKRKKFAQKAKFEKKKYAIKKKKFRANSIKLGTVLSIQGMRDIMDMHDGEDIALDEAMDEADAQEIQSEVMERMAAFGIEMEDMQEIQDALDIPMMEDDLEMDVSEEEDLMAEIRASEMSTDQIDIEAESQISVERDVEIEEDLGDIETEEVSIEDL